MTDIETLIAEFERGLEGVTPGEWLADPDDRPGYEWYNIIRAEEPNQRICFIASYGTKATAEHIARCSPPNIRALIDALREKDKTIAALQDKLAEGLPNGAAKAWPERFMGAIHPGADLAMVWPRFALWLLTEELRPVKYPECAAAIADVAALYREWVETGKNPHKARWLKAQNSADAAAYAAAATAATAARYDAAAAARAAAAAARYAAAAARYAAAAAARYAAAAARYAAADAAAAAVYVAYYAADAADASDKSYVRMADKLIKLLEAA